MLKRLVLGLALSATVCGSAYAGCSGVVIMGTCHGTEVMWDTHGDGQMRQDPPPGFYYDKRGTAQEQQNPNNINPFTGRDAHDANHSLQQPMPQIGIGPGQ